MRERTANRTTMKTHAAAPQTWWNQGSRPNQIAWQMACLFTLSMQQSENSSRSWPTAGNKKCCHRSGKKQLRSPFWRKGRSHRRLTTIDQLAWPAVWWKPKKELWMSAVSENRRPTCAITGKIPTVSQQRRSSHLSLSRKKRSPVPYIIPAFRQWPWARASERYQSSITYRCMGDVVQGRINN